MYAVKERAYPQSELWMALTLAPTYACVEFARGLFVGGESFMGYTEPVLPPPQLTQWSCCGKIGSTAQGCVECRELQ